MPAASLQPQPGEVVAVSPADAWLLGSTYDIKTGFGGSFVDHWNGRRWQRVTLRLACGTILTAIDARGRRDVWITGGVAVGGPSSQRTKITFLHWGGRSWRRLPEPGSGLGFENFAEGVRILPDGDAWAVGWDKLGPDEDQQRLPLSLHWNGRR